MRNHPSAAVLLLLVLFFTFEAQHSAQSNIQEEQHLTAIFGTWIPTAGELQVQDFAMRNLLAADDRQLLAQSLESGRVVIRGGGTSNRAGVESPRARLIVLFTGPPGRATKLPLPDASNVVYVQDGETFRRYPPEARTLTRFIEFTPNATRPNLVTYMIERASFGGTGGSIFIGEAPERTPRTPAPSATPVKIKDVKPVYSAQARQAGIQGSVVVEITIAESGDVAQARVLRSLPLLDQAALDCVKQWKYAPVPRPIVMTVAVSFMP